MVDRELRDPLGRRITLSDRTWFGHIVKGHPEIAAERRRVEAAIESPQQIRLSRLDIACRLYFGAGPRKGVRIMVVADVRLGVVKTAHLARRLSGGEVEWPS
ncbi:MAG: hypothetical protein ACYTE6_09850 [Planctomycetota bacterium]|jgi:hypothetical protein